MANVIYLVRHAENVANLTKEFSCRKIDYPLTEKGRLQAQQTAEYFAGKNIQAIFCSPLKRARETAEIIAHRLGLEAKLLEQLREINVGRLEDMPPTAEAWDIHNQIVADWILGKHETGFPGGENYLLLRRRFYDALRLAVAGRDGENVILVGHGGMFSFTIHDLCPAMNPEVLYTVENHNCSISVVNLETTGDKPVGRLLCWADCNHLHGQAADLVSGLLEGGVNDVFAAVREKKKK